MTDVKPMEPSDTIELVNFYILRSGLKSCQHLHDKITNSGKIALKRIGVRTVISDYFREI